MDKNIFHMSEIHYPPRIIFLHDLFAIYILMVSLNAVLTLFRHISSKKETEKLRHSAHRLTNSYGYLGLEPLKETVKNLYLYH